MLTKYDTSTSKFFTQDIANELAEMNRLKRLELKMKHPDEYAKEKKA